MAMIVDLSQLTSGRFCARLAAVAGDEVCRYSGSGTNTGPGVDRPFWDTYLSSCILVSTVRWEDRADREVVESAIRRSDAVISSYQEGRFDSPYDRDAINTLAPNCVHVIVSPFGLDGPYNDLHSSSLIDWAASGYLYITGEPDKPPLPGPVDVCAYTAGYFAAIALEAGLARVRRGGRPETIDISHMESMLGVHQLAFSNEGAGSPMRRAGNDVGPATYPHGSYEALDGDLFVGIVTDEEWDRFLIATDRIDLCGDPRFESGSARKKHKTLVDGLVQTWCANLRVHDAAAHLQANRVPATECSTPDLLLTDEQLKSRHFFLEVALRPGRSTVEVPGDVLSVRSVPRNPGVPSAMMPAPPDCPPLTGIKVLDMSLWWAGPLATRILGDLGADVIRIERPAAPRSRHSWPLSQRLVHEQVNRNKRSVVVDLNQRDGAELVLDLVAETDIFVQNFRPGVADRMGLGWELACQVNPRLVYISLSGYGSMGPKSTWGTYGTLSEAASAVRWLTHYPGEGGMRLGDQLPDAICGLAGALGALRGLRVRERTGVGCLFDISQLEAYVALIGEHIAEASAAARHGQRPGQRTRESETAGIYRCRGDDQWVVVSAHSRDLASLLVDTQGHSPTEADPESIFRDMVAMRTASEVTELAHGHGLAAFPVVRPADLVGDSHLEARGSFRTVTFDGLDVRLPTSPLRACGTPMVSYRRGAPMEGQHTEEVMAEYLRLDQQQIALLQSAGTVRQWTPEPGLSAP